MHKNLRLLPLLANAWLATGCGAGELSGDALSAPLVSAPADCPSVASAHVKLPSADAPHPEQASDTWYYVGHLFGEDGHRYGIQLAFFEAAALLPPSLSTSGIFTVTDHVADEPIFVSQSFSSPDAYPRTENGFDLSLSDGAHAAAAVGGNGSDHIRAQLDGYAIDLALTATKPPVLHGQSGLVRLPLGPDYYYARTRMHAEGTMQIGARAEHVSGDFWFEHQYGVDPTMSWQWFSAQLDDGRDVMVYHRFLPAGLFEETDATIAEATCGQRTFRTSQVRVKQLGTWRSPSSGVEYGSDWQLDIPSEELSLRVTPRRPGSEVPPDSPNGRPYIGADCDVSGTQHGTPVHGYGWLEQLTL